MTSAFHVGAAAQIALSRRLETLAFNISNSGTVGFRADGVKFDEVLAQTSSASALASTSFPNAQRDYISTMQGAVQKSGNPLDLAIRGDAWFSLMTPGGQAYTRDGRLSLTSSGEIKSVNGYSVLDASGAPLFADPSSGEIQVSPDGMISQGGKQVGAIGLFNMNPSAKLTRYDNSCVMPNLPPAPTTDFVTNGIAQGFIEQSNVDPVREMTRLIEVQRAFENIAASMDLTDSAQQDAIKTLGSSA